MTYKHEKNINLEIGQRLNNKNKIDITITQLEVLFFLLL